MKKAPIKKILILVTILAVPGFLYYLLQEKGKNRYRDLAYFGPKQVDSTFHTKRGKKIPDTIYHTVSFPAFKDQLGRHVVLNDTTDQIMILGLFYTRGGASAQTVNGALSGLYKNYKPNVRLKFLSISLDPEQDSPQVLDNYGAAFEAKSPKWLLLTGDKSSVHKMVREGLLLEVVPGEPIAYTNMIVLLDHKHRIRGYYEAANAEAIAKLEDEIKVLLSEELRNIKDGR